MTKIRGNQRVTSATPEGAYEALEKYGRDLVADAAAGRIDPVIGRDAEIRRVVQILSRKTKNNPVLIGDPGVGKTAIVEGLAQRIYRGDVPEGLRESPSSAWTWVEDAISILRGLRERLERFHGVKIADNALIAAVILSHRYITDRFLPDKAIDLVDEACAMLRTEIDSMPAELDELTRRVMRLEIEEAALSKETDKSSAARLADLRKELADLRAEADSMRAQWEAERRALRKVQALREELEQLRQDAEQAERSYDLERAAELRLGRLPELERRLRAEEEQLARKQGSARLLREVVTDEEIAQIVDLMFDSLRERLAARSQTLELTEAAWRLIAEEGFDPVYVPPAAPLHHAQRGDPHRARAAGWRRQGRCRLRVDATADQITVSYENPG